MSSQLPVEALVAIETVNVLKRTLRTAHAHRRHPKRHSHVSSDKTGWMKSYLKEITLITTVLPQINSKEESSSL
ncbi:hypothetical protein DPX16_14174 [Anabarilius grahami]|uniref:Uncharacterized protein n=1 Tax=Anabarilius grahami TaxID=495550 RepID=A0A3N0XF03_ANAGA|nr:hypothetical protein DPX16_14174 [Anabarilius grahami]